MKTLMKILRCGLCEKTCTLITFIGADTEFCPILQITMERMHVDREVPA